MKPKIIVKVKGGNVEFIFTNSQDVEVVIVDMDNPSFDDSPNIERVSDEKLWQTAKAYYDLIEKENKKVFEIHPIDKKIQDEM